MSYKLSHVKRKCIFMCANITASWNVLMPFFQYFFFFHPSFLRIKTSCSYLFSLSLPSFMSAVHSLPHLTVLSLSGCSKITDDGVELIAENLQKLRALDLSWCPRITDAALEYIACDLNMLEELTLDRFV